MKEAQRVITALARELHCASGDCHDLQVSVSSLVEKSNHEDLVAEFEMLQELDRLHQTLCDLANIVDEIDMATLRPSEDLRNISHIPKLTSLRHRMFPETQQEDAVTKTGAVSWF